MLSRSRTLGCGIAFHSSHARYSLFSAKPMARAPASILSSKAKSAGKAVKAKVTAQANVLQEKSSVKHKSVHEDVFVSNARRALDSLLSRAAQRSEHANHSASAEGAEDDEDGEMPSLASKGFDDEEDRAVQDNDSLKTDFADLASVTEAPYTYADHELSPEEAASMDSHGEEEHRLAAHEAVQRWRNGTDRVPHPDVDATDMEETELPTPATNSAAAPGSPHAESTHHTELTRQETQEDKTQEKESPRSVRTYKTTFHNKTFDVTTMNEDGGEAEADSQHPVSLNGRRFPGELADALREAAQSHGFVSPFWSTVEGFAQHGLRIADHIRLRDSDPTSEEGTPTTDTERGGVVLYVSQRRTVMYNLAQTDAPSFVRQARRLQPVVRWLRRQADRRQDMRRPKDMLGGFLGSWKAGVVRTHPRFEELQHACPLWISAREILRIGARVRQEELDSYAAQVWDAPPRGWDSRDEAASYAKDSEPEDAATAAFSRKIGVDLSSHTVFYNVHQLVDRARFLARPSLRTRGQCAGHAAAHGEGEDPLKVLSHAQNMSEGEHAGDAVKEMASWEPRAQDYETAFFRCASVHGRRYSPWLTFSLREYCKANHFPTVGVQLWISEEALRRHHGHLLTTPRTARDASWRNAHSFKGERVTDESIFGEGLMEDESESAGAIAEDAAADEDETPAVVPKPFVTLVRGTLFTVVNADQTDIAEELWERYRLERKFRDDMYRSREAHW